MQGYNRVQLLGNLGAPPELRQTSGGPVLKLRMATSEQFLDRDKVRQERTEWHTVTVFGKRAEGLAKCLDKGSRLLVEGSIRTSSYEKDGEKRYSTEIVANDVLLQGGGPKAPQRATGATSGPPPDVDDDDLPF
jgi:single-strand DNA-binding protein